MTVKESFYKIFQQHAHNENIALYTPDGQHYSYSEILRQAEQLNHNFYGCVANKRLLIFILCQQNAATAVAITALLTGKHVALLIPDSINEEQLKKLTDSYQPNIIYHTDNDKIHFVTDKKHHLHSELCLLLSTSGSTGSPKQVKLSRNNLFENARSIITYLNIDENEKAITSLPLNYSYGLSVLTSHLLAGASILVTDASIMTRKFWQQLEEFHISSIAGVPYTYQMFQRLKLTEKKLPHLNMMTQAGGKLDAERVHLFADYAQRSNKQFFIMYGQTEATARMAYLKPVDVLKFPESIGSEIPGGCLSLIDENNTLINETETIGELVYKGPNVMMGYAVDYNNLSIASELDELKTGDLAYRNVEGLYFITGRKSRFLKIFGMRVSLSDIEQSLKNEAYEVVCSGQDDCLTILVVFNGHHAKSKQIKQIEDEIKRFIHERFNIHPDVVKVTADQSIPLNDNGKIDYKKVYEYVIEASL